MKDVAIRLAERVRELRISSSMTQARLASRAGVTVETVARLERVLRGRSSANSNPSLETLVRLSDALGVEVADLLNDESRPRAKDDRLQSVLRGTSAETRRRVLRVVEALVREEQGDSSRPATGRRKKKR